jgi:phosphoribosylformimino-5-aminoimidazole carboxamide ribotide isomerase
VDAGFADAERLSTALADPMLRPVLGSESQQDDELLRQFRGHPRLVLSLDFFADGFRGPPSILDGPELWPDSVVVMTLASVGSAAGPDFARLRDIIARAGDRAVIAAGGVRDEADIRALSELGVAAALVATSLHDGTLTSAQLASLGT